jgi:hypothetical protein
MKQRKTTKANRRVRPNDTHFTEREKETKKQKGGPNIHPDWTMSLLDLGNGWKGTAKQ